jgi:DNA polymerase-3 subunit alpha
MGVTILSPDVNESGIDFSVVYATPDGDPKLVRGPFGYTGSGKVRDKMQPRIRFGLGAVRGIGEAAIMAILEARQSGPFRDMFDFAARVDAKRINKGVLEALVYCGALDSLLKPLGVSRSSAAASVELAMERSKAATKDRAAGQSNLFGLFAAASSGGSNATASGDKYVESAPWDSKELLAFEKKALGFYLSGHPLDRYGRLAVLSTADIADQPERSKVKLAGMVEGYRERPMKTGGGKMAFFEFEDRMGRIEVKVRPQQVDAFASVLASGEPIVLKGMIAYDRRNQDEDEENAAEPTPQILLDEAQLLSDFIRVETRAVMLRIAHERARSESLQKLAELLRTCRGGCPVTLTLSLDDGAEVQLSLGPEFRVEASDPMLAGLEKLFGERVAELRTA